ncbi:MAG: TonB-dependent receptor [Xanthomonadales bacterium]|nr:TonB-dependent receptor [Xanthomonadales bacterium]
MSGSFQLSRLGAAVVAVLLSWQVQAQQREFDIAAGPLRQSIPEFARQAGVQVIAPGDALIDQRAGALKGQMDSRAALLQLIARTDLRIVGDDGQTITLAEGHSAAPSAPAPTGGGSGGPASEGPIGDDENSPPTRQEDPPADPAELDRVTVVGTYLQGTNAETVLPITVLGREEIDLSGVSTASELLSQLPQAAEFDNSETSTGPNDARGDAASVNLRGIGSGNTLVLLNGRRIAPHPISAGEVPRLSSNINQIPLGAVQSIEVLRDGASALYGSDAVAGVINTTLRRNYEGAEVSARYGNVTEGSMHEASASLLGGINFNGDRSNWLGFVSFYDRGSLGGDERDLTADLRERAGNDAAGWNNTSVSGPFGRYTTGFANADGSFRSRPTPGGASNGQFHTRPGDDGVITASGNLPNELRYDFAPDFLLIPETRRVQLFSALSHAFDNGVNATLDAYYYRADSLISNAAVPISSGTDNNIYVPASNYYNPFGSRFYGPGTANPDIQPLDVLIRNYRPLEIGRRDADVTSRSYQITGSLNGSWGDWDWDVGASYGEGRTTDIGRNMISESRLREQLALDTPEAFNVFGGPGANSAAVLDAVRINTTREGETGLGIVDARINGTLMELPGGDLQAAAGLEFRHESYTDRRDEFTLNDDVIAQSVSSNADGSRDISSAFAEVLVPIFGDPNALPGLQRLEVSAAGRIEKYSDFGSATKPKVGLAWTPVNGLMLRASYNEGFRAPTLAQIFVGDITRRSTGVPDPYRADVTGSEADLGTASRQIIRGGNRDLGPEEARARNLGLVLDVPFVDGLSLTVDHFRIRQTDVIDTFGETDQLALDFLLRTTGQGSNANVVRLPVTPEDAAAFAAYNAANPGATRTPVGEVDFVRDTFINISSREVSGMDYGLRYRLPESDWGRFTLRADMSRFNRFEQRRDDDSPLQQQIGINGLPRTRGVLSVHWRREAWEAGIQANYVSSFFDTSAPVDGDEDFEVGSWTTCSVFGGYRFEGGALEGLSLRLGANNVFDRDPPLADENRGFYEGIHDARGRFVYADVRYSW